MIAQSFMVTVEITIYETSWSRRKWITILKELCQLKQWQHHCPKLIISAKQKTVDTVQKLTQLITSPVVSMADNFILRKLSPVNHTMWYTTLLATPARNSMLAKLNKESLTDSKATSTPFISFTYFPNHSPAAQSERNKKELAWIHRLCTQASLGLYILD